MTSADRQAEELMPPDPDDRAVDEDLLEAELNASLRAAFAEFAELAPDCHKLLAMLITDPPPTYAEVSSALGMPVGSIGPTRSRCLNRLRRSPRLAAFLTGQGGVFEARKTGR